MRALTFALTQPEAPDALASLADASDPAVVEAVVEILARPHSAALAPRALALLADSPHPLAIDALLQALDSPLVTVRLTAVEALARRVVFCASDRLSRLLQEDDSWLVRRRVVRALALHPEPDCWQMLGAANDPHWRVRHALIQALLASGEEETLRADIQARLARLPHHSRIEGVRAYLAAHWNGCATTLPPDESAPPWPIGDPDPAVLVRKLEEMGEAGRRQHLDLFPSLLWHESERARQLAVETLRRAGQAIHIIQALGQLDDPRVGAGDSVRQLLRGLDQDRIEEAARIILHRDDPSAAQLAWALDQAGPVFPLEDEGARLRSLLESAGRRPARVRQALARLACRLPDASDILTAFLDDADVGVQIAALHGLAVRPQSEAAMVERLLDSSTPEVRLAAVRAVAAAGAATPFVEQAASDPDSRVRIAVAAALMQRAPGSPVLAKLRTDPHPLVRAATLTPERAAELIAHPERETSWHVLECAARMQKTPLWRLEPQPPWQPPVRPARFAASLSLHPGVPPHARTLGSQRLTVAPIGISGHYGLPVEGFVQAVEAGVNVLFWEPNYQTLTRFSTLLSSEQRRRLHFLAGTFEADAPRIRKDVQRALKQLQVEKLSLFLIFWTRSWERITDDVRRAVERLQQEGLIGMAGLSTHSRPLAVEALATGWNPVMVRHSAAHRGAETQVFPHAGTASILTFNNTCYGRLLKPLRGREAPRAADCYRYSLSFPAVTLCLSAPATREQLDETVQALHDPHLPEERRRLLLDQGAEVYQEETLFRRLVRSKT